MLVRCSQASSISEARRAGWAADWCRECTTIVWYNSGSAMRWKARETSSGAVWPLGSFPDEEEVCHGVRGHGAAGPTTASVRMCSRLEEFLGPFILSDSLRNAQKMQIQQDLASYPNQRLRGW